MTKRGLSSSGHQALHLLFLSHSKKCCLLLPRIWDAPSKYKQGCSFPSRWGPSARQPRPCQLPERLLSVSPCLQCSHADLLLPKMPSSPPIVLFFELSFFLD